jgi:hypothetical protein
MNLLLDTEVLQDYTTEPVSVATAKAYMKINFTDDDSLIESLIKNARIWLENYTGKAYGTRSIKLTIEMTAGEWYELPGPVQSVDGVESVNGYGSCNFTLLVGSQLQMHVTGIYSIFLTYGFTTIPEDAKNDILSITAYTYQNRGIDLSNEGANLVDFPMLATQYQRRVPI